jgi:hypothetical protein
MSIRTIHEERFGPLTRSTVEITENVDHPRGDVRIVYEIHCDDCDALLVGLTESEAIAETVGHECQEAQP